MGTYRYCPADLGIWRGFLPVTCFFLYFYVQHFSLPYIYFSTMWSTGWKLTLRVFREVKGHLCLGCTNRIDYVRITSEMILNSRCNCAYRETKCNSCCKMNTQRQFSADSLNFCRKEEQNPSTPLSSDWNSDYLSCYGHSIVLSLIITHSFLNDDSLFRY